MKIYNIHIALVMVAISLVITLIVADAHNIKLSPESMMISIVFGYLIGLR